MNSNTVKPVYVETCNRNRQRTSNGCVMLIH
ncbi:hypothetical protein T08_9017 [Trichinella sp. T8]|nr:hypothetical protein T08_9017 [Trichinella sp. T8]